MKTKQEIVENWLPRYTKHALEDFGEYILLTNFNNYVDIFCEKFGVEKPDYTSNMRTATADGISIINFGMGYSLNVMTGGALILAIGMIVDNSIVVLESCFRMREEKLPFREAALRGAGEVSASVLASTITTVVVYVPMAMVGGMSGQMMGPLAWTIVFVMIASLLGAVSVVPFFSRYCVATPKKEEEKNAA